MPCTHPPAHPPSLPRASVPPSPEMMGGTDAHKYTQIAPSFDPGPLGGGIWWVWGGGVLAKGLYCPLASSAEVRKPLLIMCIFFLSWSYKRTSPQVPSSPSANSSMFHCALQNGFMQGWVVLQRKMSPFRKVQFSLANYWGLAPAEVPVHKAVTCSSAFMSGS